MNARIFKNVNLRSILYTTQAVEDCSAYPLTHYTLVFTNTVTGESYQLDAFSSADTVRIVANTSADGGILENAHYNTTVHAHNSIGSTPFESITFCKL